MPSRVELGITWATVAPRIEPRTIYEMDVLNEELHQPSYWNIYGAYGRRQYF